jgi:predicted acetyltransferase
MQVELLTAGVSDKPVIANLLQLYLHDFTDFAGWAINEHGLFDYPWLDYYWRDPDREPFLMRVDGELAGFALVHTSGAGGKRVHHLAEFFVLRKFRRKGVGEVAARHLFDRMPGVWSVAQIDPNIAAQHFWRKVVHRYTGGAFTERHDDDRGRVIQEFDTTVDR